MKPPAHTRPSQPPLGERALVACYALAVTHGIAIGAALALLGAAGTIWWIAAANGRAIEAVGAGW